MLLNCSSRYVRGWEGLPELFEEQSADNPRANTFEPRPLNSEGRVGSGNNPTFCALLDFHETTFD